MAFVMEQTRKDETILQAEDIRKLIMEERLVIYFQPIVSTYQNRVAGVEALARGIGEDGSLIPPTTLFKSAAKAGLVIELDRLCQRMAMEAFATRTPEYEDLILFINVDNSVIHLDRNISAINNFAMEAGLKTENIVLEINELKSSNMAAVQDFVNKYRNLGFMISIDDIGAGYSNLDRIFLLEPDIIKIDRELISDVHKEYHKQQVVEMVIRLAEKTGALVVAEGLEDLDEIMKVLQLGATLLQGYYIGRPMDMEVASLSDVDDVINGLAFAQKEYLANHLKGKIDFNARLRDLFYAFNQKLTHTHRANLLHALDNTLQLFPQVECAYIIDEDGHQMTDTVFNRRIPQLHAKSIFTPLKKGDDATLKAYYYIMISSNQPMYISEEYLSLASGHRCITVSGWTKVGDKNGILCLDMLSRII